MLSSELNVSKSYERYVNELQRSLCTYLYLKIVSQRGEMKASAAKGHAVVLLRLPSTCDQFNRK